jgi:hypothetical protein
MHLPEAYKKSQIKEKIMCVEEMIRHYDKYLE